jgi:hypothetical protein
MKEGAALPFLLHENEQLRQALVALEHRVRVCEGRADPLDFGTLCTAAVSIKKRAREDHEYGDYLRRYFHEGSAEDPARHIPVAYIMEFGVGCLEKQTRQLDARVAELERELQEVAAFEAAKRQDQINRLTEQLGEASKWKLENERLDRDNKRLRGERAEHETRAQEARKTRRKDFVELMNQIRKETRDFIEDALGVSSQTDGDKLLDKHKNLFRKLDADDRSKHGD